MALQKAGLQLSADGASEFLRLMRASEGAMSSFVSTAVHAGTKVGAVGQTMIGAFRELGASGVRALTDVGRKAADLALDFGGKSLKGAMDLQDSMLLLGATSGATAGQLGTLKTLARDLGADLTLPATSAADAGKAMLELSKAGLSVNDVMRAAKGTLQLAAAANISEAEAAEIAANALNSFKLSGDQVTMVADLLAAAANKSSIEVTDAAASFKMASAVFAAFQSPAVGAKQAMTDLTTAIALLGNAGIKGSDAGTSLKQMLLQLTGPSDKSKAVMIKLARSIGVTGDIAFTAEGKMRPLKEIIDLVARSTKNMTEEQRALAITQIFGADASRSVIALMQAGPQAFDDMSAAITRQGAAADLANARNAGLRGAIDGLKSTLETVGLTLAEPFLEPISQGIRRVAMAISKLPITKWAERTSQALGRFMKRIQTGAFADIGPYLMKVGRELARSAVQWIADAIPATIANLNSYRNKIIETILTGLPTLINALGQWGAAFVDWVGKNAPTMLSNFTQSATSLITLIGNKAPAIITALGQWGGAFINWVVTATPGLLSQIGIAVGKLITAIGQQLPGIATALAKWGAAFVAWAPTALPKLMTELGKLYTSVTTWIPTQAAGILLHLSTWGATLSNWVTNALPNAMARLLDYRNQTVNFILTNAPIILDKLGSWGAQLVAWITNAAPTMLSTFTAKTVDLINIIGARLPAIIDALGKWGLALINWIVTSAPGMLSQLGIAAGKLIDAIGTNIPGIVTALAKWGAAFVSWITTATPKLLSEFLKLYSGLITWITDRVPTVASTIAKWATEFYAWVGPASGKLIIAAGEMFGALLLWIVQKGPELTPKLLLWAAEFGKWITLTAVPNMLSALGGLGTTLFNWIVAKATDIAKEGSIGRSIVDGIKNGVSSAWSTFLTWMDSTWAEFVFNAMTFFGIASPSTLMADKIGKPLIEGVMEGVKYYTTTIKTFMVGFFRDYVFAPLTTMVAGAYANARTIIEQLQAGFESMKTTIYTFTTSFFDTYVIGPINGAIAATGVYDKARKIIEQIQTGFESMKTTISAYTGAYFNTNIIGPITTMVNDAYTKGQNIVEKIWDGMKYHATTLYGFATSFLNDNIITPLANFLPSVFTKGKNVVENVWDGMKYHATALYNFVTTYLNDNIITSFATFLPNIFTKGKNTVESLWDGMKYHATTLYDFAASYLKDNVVGAWDSVVNPIKGAAHGMLDRFMTGMTEKWGGALGLETFLKGFFGTDLINAINNALNAASSATGWIPAIVSVGKGIVEGIWKGIQDYWQTLLLDKIGQAVNDLPQWIKDILGIHSPSKVAAVEIGAPFAAGIGVGFAEEMARVQQMITMSVANMAYPQIVQPVASAAQIRAGATTISNSMQRNYYYSPTYGATPPSPMQDFAVMRALEL